MDTRTTHPSTLLFLLFSALFAAPAARAAGFSLYETNVRGQAMGGANVGWTGDASAVQVNPANMTQAPGAQSMVGAATMVANGHVEIQGHEAETPRMQWFVVPHLYATDEIVSNRVWIGVGEYSEYGLGSAYDNNWLGRYNSIDTRLESYTVSPVIAVKVTEDLSLAAGPRIMYIDFYNKRANAMRLGNRIVQAGTSEIEGSSYGYGWLVGANYRLTEDWTFGAVYRSRVYQQIDNGEVDFSSDYPQYVPSDRVGAEADIIMPSSATLGTNYKLLDKKLDIGTDVTWTEWSTYDSLNIIFDRPMHVSGRAADLSEKDWSDVWRYGFGASYQLLDWMSVMGGYVFDMDPINRENTDFMLPSGNRNLFSFGLGFTYADFTLQVAYTYVFLVDTAREVDGADSGVRAKSTFCDTDSHVISMSLSYVF